MEYKCQQCPRQCGTDRRNQLGFCGVPWEFRISRVALHPWEEPSISGTRGSGTVFFAGCNLHCVFCQNREISHTPSGRTVSAAELKELMLRLQSEGAHNINLVTPTHYACQLADVLKEIRSELRIPVVYNCGGYESVDTLKKLEGLVDIYLPDFKYRSATLAEQFSGAADYYPVALEALREMLRQTGAPHLDADGMLLGGIVVRHLLLPAHRDDSIALLRALAAEFGTDAFLLSLMSQYTPSFATDAPYPELHRRVTTFEYNAVLTEARSLGFDGYFQARSSASADFTPDFHEKTF